MKAEIQAYLDRIGWTGEVRLDIRTLAALVKAHRCSVPYETLDLWFRRDFSLEPAEIYDKIVTRRRGGYCFELNGGFSWLLRGLGFNVREYFGRWLYGEDEPVPMRRHRVVCVALPDRSNAIADVGIGLPFMFSPLDFVFDTPQSCDGQLYRIVRDPVLAAVVECRLGGKWTRIFSFETTPQQTHDFDYAHWWCRTHPKSSFLSRFWIYLPRPDGTARAIALSDDGTGGWKDLVLCVRTVKGELVKTKIADAAHLSAVLLENFGIDYSIRNPDS